MAEAGDRWVAWLAQRALWLLPLCAACAAGDAAPAPQEDTREGHREAATANETHDCNLNTGYAGDEYCLLPPPPDKGFQVHIGPSDYANPEREYLLMPAEEVTTDFPAV